MVLAKPAAALGFWDGGFGRMRVFEKHGHLYIRDNGGWNNWSMIEIEKYKCKDKYEAEKRERYYIETLKAALNQTIPTRTKAEYRIDNEDKIKQYRIDNEDEIKESAKEYRIDNKDKIKEHDKIYRIANREKIRAKAWKDILDKRAKNNIV
jgi:hypothetical protein